MLTVVASLAAEHRWRDRFTALTADVWVLPDFLAAEKACAFLAYLVDSRQPDLMLLSNSAFAYDVLGYVRTRYPGLPVVDLNHMEEGWDDGGHPGRAARCTALLDRHWVVSGHLRHWLLDRGVEASKVEVLHWFADVDSWKPNSLTRAKVRARLGIAPQCVVIAYAGRLCAQKRPELFAASLGELARRGSDFVALVLGDGELAGSCGTTSGAMAWPGGCGCWAGRTRLRCASCSRPPIYFSCHRPAKVSHWFSTRRWRAEWP